MVTPELEQSYAELRRLPLFDGMPNADLWAAMADGGIERQVLARDVLVADPAARAGGRVFFVAAGQVAVAVFDPGELAVRQARPDPAARSPATSDSLLLPPPLARLAKKNVALFGPGDLFNSAALAVSPGTTLAFYTVEPTRLVALTANCIGNFVMRFPFFETRLRRAIEVARARLQSVTGVKQEILDFFVRQGLAVSGEMVRVRQLDLCIDCKLCEIACEERYGAKRLTLGGYQLGMLDFVYTCRTCTDQRCIDPCEFDAIRFDTTRREVVIEEANCTGCTLCAQLCPYGAIEMVDIEEPADPTYRHAFKARLDRAGALGFGPGTARAAPVRRVANKCDHCVTYGEQACISACPTGSLIEISAYDLFRERSPDAVVLARSGYDQPAPLARHELLPTRPFVKGARVRDAGLARVKRRHIRSALVWAIGLCAWFLVAAEIALRLGWPGHSLQYRILVDELLATGLYTAAEAANMALPQVGYHAGISLAVNCGFVGTGLLLLAALYPMMRRVPGFRLVARNQVWFDLHMMAGTVGPMFILLHSAFKLDNWVSAAFWSMIIVVVSGIVGRYLYTQVPDLLSGRELEELDHRRGLEALRARYPEAVALADAELLARQAVFTRVAARAGVWRTLLWIVLEDLRRPGRWFRRRVAIGQAAAPRAVIREITARAGRLTLIDRRRVLSPRAQLVLHSWKKVHVPFSILMLLIASVHIWVAFTYSM
jgi:Fe-S-cluster-containing hydrogenase component 2